MTHNTASPGGCSAGDGQAGSFTLTPGLSNTAPPNTELSPDRATYRADLLAECKRRIAAAMAVWQRGNVDAARCNRTLLLWQAIGYWQADHKEWVEAAERVKEADMRAELHRAMHVAWRKCWEALRNPDAPKTEESARLARYQLLRRTWLDLDTNSRATANFRAQERRETSA